MRWVTAVYLFFILVSCATIKRDTTSYRGYSVEKEFIPYVKSFEKDCNLKVKIHIRFSDTGADALFLASNIIGYCWPIYPKFIHIDPEWWDRNLLSGRREELIYHELGHCVLNRMHDNKIESGIEKSLMSTNMFTNPYQYIVFKDKYIKELCKVDN